MSERRLESVIKSGAAVLLAAALLAAARPLCGAEPEPPPEPLSPQASLAAIQLRDGFSVELVAAEPLVADPIALDWSADGKLWVVEMADYPSGVDGEGMPGGRIRVLEDTDGDGRFDKSIVFIDGLSYPSGVMTWRDGVLISAAPDIIFAEDTDGDLKCDRQQVLYRGFTPGNPQHQVNGFRWGLDNWIHLANGDAGGVVKSMQTGRAVAIGGRDVRIRPDVGELDLQTGRSQYGRSRDDWGTWFGTSNSQPIMHFVLADHQLRRNPHVVYPPARVTIASSDNTVIHPIGPVISHWQGYQPPGPGKPHRFGSACSTIVYRDDWFGPEFVQNTFTCEPAHNLVQRRVLDGSGLTFTSRRAEGEEQCEFLASTDAWFRPTTCRMGPDGALWVVDMYRLVIEHPDLIDDELQRKLDLRAGHDKGRIYRVVPSQRSPRPVVRLDQRDTRALVAALASSNGWIRDKAQQMLIWHSDPAAEAPLIKMIREHPRATARLHALCTLDRMESLTSEVIEVGLMDPHSAVRRHAARLFGRLDVVSPQTATAMLKCCEDKDLHVRLECAYVLGQWTDDRSGRALGRMAVRHADDPYLLAGVMSSVNRRNLDQVLAEVFADSQRLPQGQLVRQLLSIATATGDDTVLIRVMGIIVERGEKPYQDWQLAALGDVLGTLRRHNMRWNALALRDNRQLQETQARVAAMLDAARRIALDVDAELTRRSLAIKLLRYQSDPANAIQVLGRLLSPQTPIELQRDAIRTLSDFDDLRVVGAFVQGWRQHGHEVRREIIDVLLSRRHWRDELLNYIERRLLLASDLDLSRRHRLLSDREPSIRARAERLLATQVGNTRRAAVVSAHQPVLDVKADSLRGEKIFKTKCASCHRVDNSGQAVGPDRVAMSRLTPSEALIGILDPNRFVEPRYRSYAAVMKDGRQFVGILTDEVGHALTLIGLEGQRTSLLRSQIDELSETGQSLMPEGFEKELTRQDLADVIAYLGRRSSDQRLTVASGDGSFTLGVGLWSIDSPSDTRYAVFANQSATSSDANVRLDAVGNTLSKRLPRADSERLPLVGHLFLPEGKQQISLQADAGIRSICLVPVTESSNWRQPTDNTTSRIVIADNEGRYDLTGAASERYGEGVQLEGERLAFWVGQNRACWTLKVKQAGQWLVFVDYACGRNPGRSTLTIESGPTRLKRRIIGTGSWKRYRPRMVGTVSLEAGYRRLNLRCAGLSDDCLMDVRAVSLVPAGQ